MLELAVGLELRLELRSPNSSLNLTPVFTLTLVLTLSLTFLNGVSLRNNISNTGIPKARVLPEPVVASTHTSWDYGWGEG
jgi:hypothetical protein